MYRADYDEQKEMGQLDRLLRRHSPGPYPLETNKLSYAEAVQAVEAGVMPGGQVLDQGATGLVGRAVVVDMHSSTTAVDSVRFFGGRNFVVAERLHVSMHPAARSRYSAAAAARMLSSETRPFDLEPAQIVLRLTSSTLLATMNTMMLRGTGSQTVHPPTSEELGDFQVALAPDSATAEHPWLGRAARSEVDFPDDDAAVTEYMQLESEVRISTATYADGQPATHVRIVRTGGDEYFAVAWQIGLEHMASLRGTTASSVQPMDDSAAVATPPAEPATSSNAEPSRSELNNLLEALK